MLKLVKFQSWTNFGYNGSSGAVMARASVAVTGTNWHMVKLAFQGNRIDVFYDRNQMISVRDTEAQPYLSGGISVDMWTDFVDDTMSVSELIVRPLVLEIRDPQLEAALRSSLSDYISATSNLDLPRLTCLWACNRQITNLDGLQWATNLMSLYLNDNAVSDLIPLKGLTRLSALELYGNSVADLSPLTALTNLTCLVLGGHPVRDYSPLSGLTNLTVLSVRQGAMVSLTNLQKLPRLISLKLWENSITSILPLAGLTNLTCLDLRWNSVTNFASSLGGITNLTSLYLGSNCISNLPPMQSLKQLTLLNLDDNRIGDLSSVTNLSSLRCLAVSRNGSANFSVLSNLSELASLELRGNSISNLDFLSSMGRLSYVDLAYNSVSDLRALTNLTGLNSLVLAGNPLTDFSPLGGIPNLTNLWLFDSAISNVSFVTKLLRLNHLNLDQNRIADIGSLAALTNLTGLGLRGNPISDYSTLTNFAGLACLRLEGNRLGRDNLRTFLPTLTQLRFLSLNHNQIDGLSQIQGLTRLEELYLRRNRLGSIQILTNLPNLLDVDVSLNMLDLTPGSAPMSVIRGLESRRTEIERCACGRTTNGSQGLGCHGIAVAYQPQNQAPGFTSLMINQRPPVNSTLAKCFIPADTNSFLTVSVWEDPLPEDRDLLVTAASSNTNLVSPLSNPVPGTNYGRTLEVVAGSPSGQPATITLSVTDDVLLASSTNIIVNVVANTNLQDVCPDVDPGLIAGLSVWTGKPVRDLSIVDLLMLSELYVQNVTSGDSCVWEWLTNVTTFSVSGNSTTNLSFLTNLTHVTSLTLNSVNVMDFSPLIGLSNLLSLSLYDGSISNLNFLTNLTQLTSLVLNNVTVTDYSALTRLTNLLSLSLYGQSISNLSSLTNLTHLNSLKLSRTRVGDLSPLAGLTNLQFLSCSQNRIADISSLTNLSRLVDVDLTLNLLDFSPESAATITIYTLENRGVIVYDWPQRQAPTILINSNWLISADRRSWLYFRVLDNAQWSELSVTNFLTDNDVIRSTNVTIGQEGEAYYGACVDWYLKVIPSGNGTVNVTLTATNDAGLSGDTSISVTVVTPLDVTSSFYPETNVMSWVTDEEAPWFGQTNISYLNIPTAQSGSTTNNGDSWLQAAVNGPGTLTFWWKVSCEPRDNETNYNDFLCFYIDTNEQARIEGEVDWQKQVWNIPGGAHRLLWDYCKDYAASGGMDAGWVAQVSFVPGICLQVSGVPTNAECHLDLYLKPSELYEVQASTNLVNWFPLRPSIAGADTAVPFVDVQAGSSPRFYRLQNVSVRLESPDRATNGVVQLVLHSTPGLSVEIQSSTNLVDWSLLATVTNTSGEVEYSDIMAANSPVRFYRAALVR